MKNKIIFKTLMLKGEAGSTIVSMEKTGHVGTADIYTITFNDGSTTEISLENMSAITSVEKTSSTDTEDIYTITCADGSTQTFSVLNHNADIAAMSDDIDTIDARVDNFINSVVPNTVETLWTGSIKDVGDSATLSKAVSNFDYIDLYLLGSADSKYIRVPATQTAVDIQQQNLSDDASSNFLRLWEMGVSISGSTVSITKSIAWAWDDPNNSNPTVTANAQNGVPITRIDGVKVASGSPAELVDIRIGANGTIYNSAGDSVREQFLSVESGENVLVEHGYFTDAQKEVNSTVGFGTVKYDSNNQVLLVNGDRNTSGTATASINFNDFGLSNSNSSVLITDYQYLIYSVDTDVPSNVAFNLRIWAYAGASYRVLNVPITQRDGSKIIIDLKKLFSDNNLSASYNTAYIRGLFSDSYTFDSSYIHAVFYGFFTAAQKTTGLNLKEKTEYLTETVADLSTNVASVQNLPHEIGEKCATGAPLTLKSVAGTLNENGSFINTSTMKSTVTEKIKCAEGDVFDYYGQSSDSVVTCMWFKSDGTILSSQKVGAGSFAHQIFTAPANADSVIFTSYGNNSASYMYPLIVSRKNTYESPLSKKVWYPCGDSFTFGEFTGILDSTFTSGKYAGKNKTYAYHIGNRTNMDVRRASTSGETMAAYSGGSVVFSNESYSYGFKSVGSDADYVTIWFGINDSGRNIPIGTIDDDDNTTFYGAWNVVLDDFTTRLTKAHIGIIISNNLAQAYVDAVIAIAKKWGIPYLDLNYDEQVPLMHYSLRPSASAAIKTKRNAQFAISSENHHPNLLAHEYESYFIEKWLLTL